jgi:DNA-binding response OmpR family regulator
VFTILVIESDQDILDMVRAALEQPGIQVLGATDAQVGFQTFLTNRPQLVLAGTPSPDIGGTTALFFPGLTGGRVGNRAVLNRQNEDLQLWLAQNLRRKFTGKDSAMNPRLLLAEDDDAVRDMLRMALERGGFDVTAVASVREALTCIAAWPFDVLLSDLHMPHAGDGFTVVSAMRHTHPQAVTLVLSGYPELDEALSAIRMQADEVLVKPIDIASLRELIRDKLSNPVAHRPPPTQSVASILEHDLEATIQDWMELVQHDDELTCVPLSFEDRTGHLPSLITDLIRRLRLPRIAKGEISIPARQHGDLRRRQGYTAAMVVEESRILQVSIFNTLQKNLARIDFSKLLLDVITIADEVDSQLKQAMLCYIEPAPMAAGSAA